MSVALFPGSLIMTWRISFNPLRDVAPALLQRTSTELGFFQVHHLTPDLDFFFNLVIIVLLHPVLGLPTLLFPATEPAEQYCYQVSPKDVSDPTILPVFIVSTIWIFAHYLIVLGLQFYLSNICWVSVSPNYE